MKSLDNITVGFIGVGVMGGALLEAVASAIPGSRITVADASAEKTADIAKRFGCAVASSNAALARECAVVFLAVKPAQIPGVAKEIAGELSGKTLVSIAAGVKLSRLQEYAGSPSAIIRLMPNLPATVGEGMIALSCLGTDPKSREAADTVKALLAKAGRVEETAESLMDSVTAVSGSGPAYAFMFIEALADAGVVLGMTRAQAYLYAAQTLKGAASMVLESGKHPGALKDGVCSPSGTTIEAVRVLEEKGFRSAVIEAALASGKKSIEMGNK